MTSKTLQLETLSCPSCMAKIEGMLKKTKGIDQSEVLFNSSRVKLTFDEAAISLDDIKARIEGLGYQVLSVR